MRIVIDSMIGLMLVVLAVGGLYLYNSKAKGEREIESVRVALQQLQEQTDYRRAVQSVMADRDVLLVHVHEQWFGGDVPTNLLVGGDRPWIDLAPPGDLGDHPPDPVVYGENQAGFWYNPTTGVFRARVSPAFSESQTLALYNGVNGTDLAGFEQVPDPGRRPLAHTPGKTPVKQYASMANKAWSQAPEQAPSPATDLITAEQEGLAATKTADVPPASPDHDTETNPEAALRLESVEVLGSDQDAGDLPQKPRPTLQNLQTD